MGLIAKLFGAAQKPGASGASMGPGPAWSVGLIEDAPAFFRALPELLPSGSILYLEDVCSRDGVALASRHAVKPRLIIAFGCWPRPNFFHIPLTDAVAVELAQFAEQHATPEIGIHIHAYYGDSVILEWHDAFGQSLRLSTSIPEERMRHFCDKLHCTYELETAS